MNSRTIQKFGAMILLVAISMLGFQCSKSDSAGTPAGGCTFTFKGTSYSLSGSVCGTDAASGTMTNAASNIGGAQLLALYSGGTIGKQIVLSLDINDLSGGSVYTSVGGSTPSVSISGTTWNFSGTLINENDPTNTGEISGKCTCTVSN